MFGFTQVYINYRFDSIDAKKDALPVFEAFFTQAYRQQDRVFEKLTTKVSLITPLLLKVEEILVFTRTRRAERLASYYHHWEFKLFNAIGKICDNLYVKGFNKPFLFQLNWW